MSQTNPIPLSNSSDFIAQHLAQANLRNNRIRQLEDDLCELAAYIDAAMFRWLTCL